MQIDQPSSGVAQARPLFEAVRSSETGSQTVTGPRAAEGVSLRLRDGWSAVMGRAAEYRLELNALLIWTSTWLAGLWVSMQAAWLVGNGDRAPGLLSRWDQWDAQVFRLIAQYGYDGPPDRPGHYGAFFPGMPLALRLVHFVVPDWVAAGLVISFVAGAVAVVALARLVAHEWGPHVGCRAVWALCLSPLAMFLITGYSESLFLAFALPAVLAARRGRWGAAGLLAAGAGLTRVTGFFLAAVLVVEFLMQLVRERGSEENEERRRPAVSQAVWLLVPPLPGLAFFAFLHSRTGSWATYFDLQAIGWGRRNIGVVDTFHVMWSSATASTSQILSETFGYRVEIAAVAVGLILLLTLLVRRRWSEALFVGGPILSLLPMTIYSSAVRTSLTWWPMWTVLAVGSCHPRWGRLLTRGYLLIAIPTQILLLAAFTTGRWAG